MKSRLFPATALGLAALAIAIVPALKTSRHSVPVGSLRAGQTSEPNFLEGNQFLHSLRGWPTGQVDTKAYERAAFHPKGTITDGTSPSWVYVGPKNNPGVTGQYYGPGPVSGRVNAIAFGSSLPGAAIYVTSPGGGVHESRDDGVTWKPLSDDWDSMNTTAAAVKPNDPNTMLVGTGDYHGLLDSGGIGVMKGTYAGGSWAWAIKGAAEANGRAISKILYDPENPSVVLMTTGRGAGTTRNAIGQITAEGKGGVYRSTNGGDTWTIVLGTAAADQRPWNNVVCGAMSPATGRRLYYAVGNGTGNVLMRSADKGKTWKQVSSTAAGLIGANLGGLDVAVSPFEPETVYLLSAADRRIWKSKNGGNKWDIIVSSGARAGFPFDDGATANYNFSQKHYDWFLMCGSHTTGGVKIDDVYCGLITLAHSADGGATWADVGLTYQSGALTHNDQQCMTFKPGAGYLEPYLGNDGGIEKMTYTVGAATPFAYDTAMNKDLYITQFYHADWDADTPQADTILGGTQDNGSPWSNASPPAWQQNKPFGDGSGSAIGRTVANPQNWQYAGGYALGGSFSFMATRNWWVPGAVMDNCPFGAEPAAFFAPLACDPNNPRYAYAASNKLWQYDSNLVAVHTTVTAGAVNATQTVASTAGMVVGMSLRFGDPNTGATYNPVQITAIPNATTVTVNAVLNTTAGSWSVESATGWQATTGGNTLGDIVLSIAVARGTGLVIFTGARDGTVNTSIDAGSTAGGWTNVMFNLPGRPVSDIAVDPLSDREAWITMQGASTTFRVAKLSRPLVGPPTWIAKGGNGLPDVPANCLCFDPDNNSRVYVGTDMGLYYTNDRGATWKNVNLEAVDRMPSNVRVTDVEVVGTGAGRTVNCATFGRGIWRVNAIDLH